MGHDPNLPVPSYPDQKLFFTPSSWTLLDEAVREIMQTGKPHELKLELSAHESIVARGEAVRGADGRLIRRRTTADKVK